MISKNRAGRSFHRLIHYCVAAAAFFAAPTGYADEPLLVGFSLAKKTERQGKFKVRASDNGDDGVLAHLFHANPDLKKSTLLIVFPGCQFDPPLGGKPILNLEEIINNKQASPRYVSTFKDPGPRWRVCPDQSAILLKPGKKVPVQLTVDFLSAVSENVSPRLLGHVYILDGTTTSSSSRVHVHATKQTSTNSDKDIAALNKAETLALRLKNQPPDSSFTIDLYYALNGAKLRWKYSNYATLFGVGDPADQAEVQFDTSDYDLNASVLPVNVEFYRRTMPLPGSTENDSGARLRNTVAAAKTAGSGLPNLTSCDTDDEFGGDNGSGDSGPQGQQYTIKGRFSTKWTTDHALHPGFGFTVEAWTNETGDFRRLAKGFVRSDGTWQLSIPGNENFQGTLLRVLYRSYSSYYKPQDEDNGTYSWKDPDWLNIGTNFSTGHRYVDTDGGQYNGVGELVESAGFMWSRLYWAGGINPVPANPLNVFFPNTFHNCSGGNTPWSCANTAGDIWLIPAHGILSEVVTHEFAHQLNNKYWDGRRPAGSGGEHTLNGCYPDRLGMALREGFADFMPGWVGYPNRNVADNGFGAGRWSLSYDLESRTSPPNCLSGYTNEIWVARTFWDLHDKHVDGDDLIYFVHRGAVPALYLTNSIAVDDDARDMGDYEGIYQDAASDGHEGLITDIFLQNRQVN